MYTYTYFICTHIANIVIGHYYIASIFKCNVLASMLLYVCMSHGLMVRVPVWFNSQSGGNIFILETHVSIVLSIL